MQYRKLGRTDLDVSSVGMGCVTFGREIDADASFQILDHAFEKGITLYDTAEAYSNGGSETVLGDWISARGVRDRIVLATKVTDPLTAERITTSVDESLQRLKTDYIDLFQLHVWDDNVPLDESLDTLTRLVAVGKIRHIGCSNWSAWHLTKALLSSSSQDVARIESVQPPYNLVQREIEPDLLPMCRDQQVGIISYSPLAAGFLTGKYRKDSEVPKGTRFEVIPGHQPIYFTDEGFRVVEGLRSLAGTSGQTMIQLALAWVMNQPGVTSVLVGARSIEHIDQALRAQNDKLPDDLKLQLEQL